jgi:hypothetical protein
MGRGQLNKNPGSYLGVTPGTPPNMVVLDRAPTTKDYRNYSLGDLWLDQPNQDLFVLVSKALGAGTWLPLGGQAGNVNDFFTDDGNTVVPNAGTVNVFGSTNINTAGNIASTINVNLNNSIIWPATTADALAGVISIDGETVFHTYDFANSPSTNLFAGEAAGNLTLLTAEENVGLGTLSLASLVTGDDNFAGGYTSGQFIDTGSRNTLAGALSGASLSSGNSNVLLGYAAGNSLTTHEHVTLVGSQAGQNSVANDNTAVGYVSMFTATTGTLNSALGSNSLFSLTTGDDNTAIGNYSLNALTTGDRNTSVGSNSLISATVGVNNIGIGANALFNLVDGNDNLAVGYLSGVNYTSTESSNICINNDGVIGDNNTIRIGTEGNGAGQQDTTFIAGIYNTTTLTNTRNVIVDSNGQLGVGDGDGTANAFMAYLPTSTAGFTVGAASNLQMKYGANGVFTVLYDDASMVYPGDGAGSPLTVTIPATGKWIIYGNIVFTNGGVQPGTGGISAPGGAIMFVMDGSTFGSYVMEGSRSSFVITSATSYPMIFNFTAGEVLTFRIVMSGTGATDWGFWGDATIWPTIPDPIVGFVGPLAMPCWIQGYQISS